MKRLAKQATAQRGVNFLNTIITNNGDIFQKIDQENDLGMDGYIEFIEKQIAYKYTVGCQIKSGLSYIRNGRGYIVSDKEHFEYWGGT